MAPRPIIVHSLAEARAAVTAAAELDVPVTLASAPEAAGYLGALWFRELVRMVSDEHPGVEVNAVLDCGEQPGHVMAALRQGLKRVRFTGPKSTAATLSALFAPFSRLFAASSSPKASPDRNSASRTTDIDTGSQ